MTTCTATYSPEDNKLRLYASDRLDEETFARVKDAGYRWAPKQELFVAPRWTPARHDLALELAGDIEAEETTLAERAEMKADRLDALSEKRFSQSNAFSVRANELSLRFEMGQPILIGHHSERSALKDKERMDKAMSKASETHRAGNYWLYRASGVEHFANMKNSRRTRANRIKTLLAELRDLQRSLSTYFAKQQVWASGLNQQQIEHVISNSFSKPPAYAAFESGELTCDELCTKMVAAYQAAIDSPNKKRWIEHTLNRLSFETEMFGTVARFEGEITPAILQVFVRTHGADKPKATKVDEDLFALECESPLPAHIADGLSLELSADEWRDLMHSCGYEVPNKAPAKAPILNFKADDVILSRNIYHQHEIIKFEQREFTKAKLSALHSESKQVRLSACGQFRFRLAIDPDYSGPRYSAPWVAVLITDQKQHPAPLAEVAA